MVKTGYGPDDGTLAPWAVAASLPFASEIVGPTITHLTALHVDVPNPYGFKASFNPVFHGQTDDGVGWVSPYHFGINEGPTVLMIENHSNRPDLVANAPLQSVESAAPLGRLRGRSGRLIANWPRLRPELSRVFLRRYPLHFPSRLDADHRPSDHL